MKYTQNPEKSYTIGFISDIHGNLPALNAVFDDMKSKVDKIICLGDIIGYNSQPKECLEKVRQVSGHVVQGNHDRDVVDPERYRASAWNPSAGNLAVRKGLEIAQERLTADQIEWLTQLPETKLVCSSNMFLCHSHPEETDTYVAKEGFPDVFTYMDDKTDLLLIGHTHRQAAVDMSKYGRHGWVVNPGSVGQPRDGQHAKYALLKLNEGSAEVELCSTSYPVNKILQRNSECDIPESTSERLK